MDWFWRLIGKSIGFIKYGMVGAVGFGIHLLALWILTDKIGFHYIGSAAIAIIIAALNNYILNYFWTFKNKKNNIKNVYLGYFQYLLSRGFTEGIYLGLLYLMTDIVGVHYMMSAVVVQVATAIIGYIIAVKWIWRKRGNNGRSINTTGGKYEYRSL